MAAGNGSALDELVKLLDLESLDADLFLGDPGSGSGRLFGGMVAAQCVIAAGRTVPRDRGLHSLHAYFLRPGRHGVPIRFVVDRIRDGRSFTTRRVKAHQAGEAIFNLSASFTLPEDGISHQDEMPEVPGPEGLRDWDEVRREMAGASSIRRVDAALEVRLCDEVRTAPSAALQRNWIRLRGTLPNDPLIHTAMLVYASDRTLVGTAAQAHGLRWGRRMAASLDHAVWVHRPVHLDDWILYASKSPASHAARGLVFGDLYYRNGIRVASVAQEALIRIPRD